MKSYEDLMQDISLLRDFLISCKKEQSVYSEQDIDRLLAMTELPDTKPVSTVIFTRGDIREALKRELGDNKEVTSDMVDNAIDCIYWERMEEAMIERGWDFITEGVIESLNY